MLLCNEIRDMTALLKKLTRDDRLRLEGIIIGFTLKDNRGSYPALNNLTLPPEPPADKPP